MRYRDALRSETLVRWAGLLVWAGNSLQLLLPLVVDAGPAPVSLPLALVLVAGLGSFLWGTLWILGPGLDSPNRRKVVAILVWLSIVGTVINDLFQVVSIILPLALRPRAATIWFVIGNVCTVAIYGIIEASADSGKTLPAMITEVFTPLGWRFVAFAVGMMLVGDRHRRTELARVNEQLVAAQTLLADRARLAERLEISRELHDSIGHHLAALNVQLELARHQAEGPAHDTVIQAQAAGRRMLTEVRSIVSTWREDAALEVGAALRQLATELQSPAVIVDIEDGLEVTEPLPARALIRCAQEIVTNAIRHAGARHVWLALAVERDGIRLVGRDDGCGREVITLGNGLRGLTERARALNGRIDVSSPVGGGFVVEMWIPKELAA